MKKLIIAFIFFFSLLTIAPSVQASFLGDILDKTMGNITDDISGRSPVPDGDFTVAPYRDTIESRVGMNTSVREYILRVTNFALAFVGLIATVMVIYGGFLYITSAGGDSPEKAKKIILYAAIGILVILISFALVNTLITQAPGGGGDEGGGTDINQQDPADMDEIITDSDKPIVTISPDLIIVEGENVVEFGSNAYAVSLETAQGGIDFTLEGGTYKEVLWDFGDGTRRYGEQVNHKYAQEYIYVVTVAAETDEAYLVGTRSIIVGGVHAGATLSTSTPKVGQDLRLDGRSSRTAVGQIEEYTWSCAFLEGDEDGCFEEQTGDRVTVSFLHPGKYEIFLEVASSIGLSDKSSVEIMVQDIKPQASFRITSTNNSENPGEYLFDAGQSRNIDGKNSGLAYVWDLDGEERRTTIPRIRHEFESDGDKYIALIVEQDYEGRTLTSDVEDQFLYDVKTFGVDIEVPEGPLEVQMAYVFRALSDKADGFEWEIRPRIDNMSPSGKELRVSFDAPGAYTVRLRGERNGSWSDWVEKKVFVQELSGMIQDLLSGDAEGEGSEGAEGAINLSGVLKPLAVIQVLYKDQEVLSGVEVERGESGYPEDLSFTSVSLDARGESGDSADLDETWSVNGNIVIGGALDIPPLLTEVGNYTITLTVSLPGNPNVRDTQNFRVRVINTLPIKEETEPPLEVGILPEINTKKKRNILAALQASTFQKKLVVDDLILHFPEQVTDQNIQKFPVSVSGIREVDGGYIDRYEFGISGSGVPASTQVVEDPRAYFDLTPRSYQGKKGLKIHLRIYDNDGGFIFLESENSFDVLDESSDLTPAGDLEVSINLAGASRSNTIKDGEWINLQAKAVRGEDNLNNIPYKWSIEGSEEIFATGNTFRYQFPKPGTYTIGVEVEEDTQKAEDDFRVVVLVGEEKISPNEEVKENIKENIEEKLKKAGVPPEEIENILKDIENLSEEELRQKLKDLGLTEEEIEDILREKGLLDKDPRYHDEDKCDEEAQELLEKLPENVRNFITEKLKGCELLEALDEISQGVRPESLADIPQDLWDAIKESSIFGVPHKIADLLMQNAKRIPATLYRIQVDPLENSLVGTDFEIGIWGFKNQEKYFRFDWEVYDPDGKMTSYEDAKSKVLFVPDVSGRHAAVLEVSNETGSIKSEVGYFNVYERGEDEIVPEEEIILEKPEPEKEPEKEKIVLNPEREAVPLLNPVQERPGEPPRIVARPQEKPLPEVMERQLRPAAPKIQEKIEQRPMTSSGASQHIPVIFFFVSLLVGGIFVFKNRKI